MKIQLTLCCFLCLCTTYLLAQNTTIKPDKACINCAAEEPTDGAVLEIQSSDKGILIPRMSTTNRTSISNLVDGLLVYDTDTKSFWYYNATQWTELSLNTDNQTLAEVLALGADANGFAILNLADPSNPQDAATKAYVDANDAVEDADADSNNEIQDLELTGNTLSLSNDATSVDLSPFENNWTLDGSDVYRNSGSVGIGTNTPQSTLDIRGDTKIEGTINLIAAPGDSSLFIGANAGMNDDGSINQNTFVGTNSGQINNSGNSNSFFGYNSGKNNTSGSDNTFWGYFTGNDNSIGSRNTFSGSGAGFRNSNGNNNTFSGFQSGFSNTSGFLNTFLGFQSGASSTNDTRNTFIGSLADQFNSSDYLDRAIAIGHNAKVDCSNCAVIGGTGPDTVSVGIGTNRPEALLHISSPITSNSTGIKITQSGNNSLIYHDNGDLILQKANQANQLVLDASGRVGIGTNTPEALLHINSPITSDTTGLKITQSADTSLIYHDNGNLILRKMNQVDQLVLDPSGNVGIGFDTPSERLEVNGNVKAQKFIGDGSMLTGIDTSLWTQSGQDIYTNNDDGRVGIGTDTPEALLHLSSPISSDSTGIKITQSGNNSLIYHNNGDLILRKMNQADQLVLDPSGNVGIGTAAPESQLDVKGSAKIEGTINLILALGDSSLFIGANAGLSDDRFNKNTFIGNDAGKLNTSGRFNTFLGYNSGNANTTGSDNTFLGFSAGLSNNTGEFNTMLGRGTGFNNTTGASNTFVGSRAGYFNETGGFNTYIGSQAGVESNSDTRNTFIGYSSGQLFPPNLLDRSIAIGHNAKVNCSNCAVIGGTGVDTVRVGIGLASPTERLEVDGNVKAQKFIGDGSMLTNLSWTSVGSNIYRNNGNVGIGTASPDALLDISSNQLSANPLLKIENTSSNSISDNIAVLKGNDYAGLKLIGEGRPNIKFIDEGSGIPSESDFQILLNSSGRLQINNADNPDDEFTSSSLVAEFGHPSYAVQFEVIGDALAQGMWINSDQRLKKDIQPLTNSLDKLMKLKAKHYKFDFDNEKLAYLNLSEREQIGLIAQELEQVFPELVITQDEAIEVDKGELEDKRDERLPQLKAVNYIGLIPVLIDGMQEQQQLLASKQEEIEFLKVKNQSLEDRVDKLESMMKQLLNNTSPTLNNNLNIEINDAQLYQNQPNPFDGNTIIKYYIPEQVKSASLQVLDQNGRIIKRIPIQARGEGQITLQANLLSAGTYSYSLVLDGRVMETKQMVLTH